MRKNTAQIFAGLKELLPEGSFEKVVTLLDKNPVYLTITKDRKTKMGDYRHPVPQNPKHRISVNGSLNSYSFLITLLHEMAHLLTFQRYGNSVAPHGTEWQSNYKRIINDFLNKNIFPAAIESALKSTLSNIKSSTCFETDLFRVLKKYDNRNLPENIKYIEEIPAQSYFLTLDGKSYQMLGKARSRYRCREVETGNLVAFYALVEVRILKPDSEQLKLLAAIDDKQKTLAEKNRKQKATQGIKSIKDLPFHTVFQISSGKKFQLLGKARTRYNCKEIQTGQLYTFHALTEVKVIKS